MRGMIRRTTRIRKGHHDTWNHLCSLQYYLNCIIGGCIILDNDARVNIVSSSFPEPTTTSMSTCCNIRNDFSCSRSGASATCEPLLTSTNFSRAVVVFCRFPRT